MRRFLIVLLAVCLMLSLVACGQDTPEVGTDSSDAAETEAKAQAQGKPGLAADYVEILKSGNYQFTYVVPYEGVEMITTQAAKGGNTVYMVSMGEATSRIVKKDGKYLAIDEKTGEMMETTAEKDLGGELDFSKTALVGTDKKDGKVFETYSLLRNGKEREMTFVFDDGVLTGVAFSYFEGEAPYFEVTEFTDKVEEVLLDIPQKTTLAISEIAEGSYTGTLSGESYTATDDEDAYSISPDIPPTEITVTIQDGQVELYAAASVTAGGVVFGAETPRSPEYTQTVAGGAPIESGRCGHGARRRGLDHRGRRTLDQLG